MAMTTNESWLRERFQPSKWKSFEEFEEYYLRRISETRIDTNYYTGKDGIERVIPPINHHPELKEYEVWLEGYAATGEHGSAQLLGKAFARNFGQACHIVECHAHLEWIEKVNKPDYGEYEDGARWDYDPQRFTIWGCGLYWSEELARKSFG